MLHFDHEHRASVAIVGGGPAGAATATHLARAGIDVLVVDSQRFPRFKACGEFISPQCLPLLKELGSFDAVRDLGARAVKGMELVGHGRAARGRFVDIGRARAPFDYGWAVRREKFDQALLDGARAAGARVIEGLRMRELLRDERGAVLGFEARGAGGESVRVRADWTLGADGLRSPVARALGVRREGRGLRRMALTTRYTGAVHDEWARIHFFDDGYFAFAPVDGGALSVNLVLSMQAFERQALPRDAAFEHWVERAPAVAEILRPARRIDPIRGVGPLSASTTKQTFDGAALVGDACGYVDPMTGEGVFFALQGAALLAEPLIEAVRLGRRDRRALDDYLRGRDRDIAPRAKLCGWLVRALGHPLLARTAFALLHARPALADLAVSASGDYAPPRELLRPAVWSAAWSAGA